MLRARPTPPPPLRARLAFCAVVSALIAAPGCRDGDAGAPAERDGDAIEDTGHGADAAEDGLETVEVDPRLSDIDASSDAEPDASDAASLDGEGPDALDTRSADAAEVSEPNDVTDLSDVPDAADAGDAGDGADTSAPMPSAPACPEVARYFGKLAFVTGGALSLAPLREPGPATPLLAVDPRARVVARVAPGEAELIVSQPAGSTCTLTGLIRGPAAHVAAWSIARPGGPDCLAPALSADRALWSVGSELLEVEPDTGLVVSARELGAAILTGPVALDPGGLVSGGGSHWLVGTADGLVVFARDDAGTEVLATSPLPDGGLAASLAPIDAGLVALATRNGPAELPGRLWLLRVSAEPHAIEVLGEPLDTPTAMTTPPVSLGCDARAGGGSHWYCPGGLVIAGGEGWVRAFAAPSGEIAWEQALEVALTGLTATGDGRVAGGGSHWLPGHPDPDDPDTAGWQLLEAGPERVRLLASGADPGCVSSPIVDGDGLVAAVAGGGIARVQTDLDGRASGWTRPGGSETGGPSLGDCGDGIPRGLVPVTFASREVSLVRAAGDFTLLGGATADGRPWIGWVDARGQVVDDFVPLTPGALPDGPLRALVARGKHAEAAFYEIRDGVRHLVLGRWLRLSRIGASTSLQYTDVDIKGLSHEFQSTMVALFEGPSGIRVERVDPASGSVSETSLPGVSLAHGMGQGPDSGHLAWGEGPTPWLYVLREDLSIRAAFEWPLLDPLGAATRADGSVLFVGTEGTTTRVLRVHPDGVELGRLELPGAAISFAVRGDEALLLEAASGLRRVSPLLTPGLAWPLLSLTSNPARPFELGSANVLASDSAFNVLVTRPTLALAAVDAEGHSTCAEAGYCLGAAPCDSAEGCLAAGCDPDQGACTTAPIETPGCTP